MIANRLTPVFFSVCLIFLTAGCAEEVKITSYATRKPADVYEENHLDGSKPPADNNLPPMMRQNPTASGETEPARMFGAIVPQGEQTWFYKLTGPVEQTSNLIGPLTDFVKSVKYEEGKPVWTLPEGWSEQQGGSQFRYATIIIPDDQQPLELTVSPLSGSDDEAEQALSNINRWRGQLGLGATTAENIEQAGDDPTQELFKLTGDEQNIYFVNIVGETAASGRMRPPMQAAPSTTSSNRTPPGTVASEPARMFGAIVPQGPQTWFYKLTGPVEPTKELVEQLATFVEGVKYEEGKPVWALPEGWSEQPGGSQFRYATISIPQGETPLELTVSPLSGSDDEVAQAVQNINRWRGQLGLDPIDAAAVEAAGEKSSDELFKKQAGDQTIYMINIVGEQSAAPMRPPFAQ